METYLTIVNNTKNRTTLTKFRLSNHTLMIEKGRHQNIDKNLRFRPFCPTRIEDEMHFLLECECYAIHRGKNYLTPLTRKLKIIIYNLETKKKNL